MTDQGQAVSQEPAGRGSRRTLQNTRQLSEEALLIVFDVSLEEEITLTSVRVTPSKVT